MGNSVSAETNIKDLKPNEAKGSPPPECPMHKKENKSDSGCPVQHGNDINPYNMVFIIVQLKIEILTKKSEIAMFILHLLLICSKGCYLILNEIWQALNSQSPYR